MEEQNQEEVVEEVNRETIEKQKGNISPPNPNPLERDKDRNHSIWSDIFWPLKQYADARDYISRLGSLSLTIGLTGIMIENLSGQISIAAGIGSAIGAGGFASGITDTLIRVFTNTDDPWKNFGIKQKGVSTLVYLIVGFFIFLGIGPGTFNHIQGSAIQYTAGLIITYLATIVYGRVYNSLRNATLRTRLSISILATLGTIFALLVPLPIILEMLGQQEAAQILQVTASELNT